MIHDGFVPVIRKHNETCAYFVDLAQIPRAVQTFVTSPSTCFLLCGRPQGRASDGWYVAWTEDLSWTELTEEPSSLKSGFFEFARVCLNFFLPICIISRSSVRLIFLPSPQAETARLGRSRLAPARRRIVVHLFFLVLTCLFHWTSRGKMGDIIWRRDYFAMAGRERERESERCKWWNSCGKQVAGMFPSIMKSCTSIKVANSEVNLGLGMVSDWLKHAWAH